jgi:hypothetical protein
MTEPRPTAAVNIDEHGNPPIAWDALLEVLASPHGPDEPLFLGTVRSDGRPHVVGIGVSWIDGALYFTTGPETVKAANLEWNAHCTIAGRMRTFDVSIEGVAERITDHAELERLAERFQADGWPATVVGETLDAPINEVVGRSKIWNLYQLRIAKVISIGSADGVSAMSFRFDG